MLINKTRVCAKIQIIVSYNGPKALKKLRISHLVQDLFCIHKLCKFSGGSRMITSCHLKITLTKFRKKCHKTPAESQFIKLNGSTSKFLLYLTYRSLSTADQSPALPFYGFDSCISMSHCSAIKVAGANDSSTP